MKLIKAHAFIQTQYSRKEGNWPKIKLLSTKWLKHQGSVQKQEGTLKPTVFYYGTVSVSFFPQEIHTITLEHTQTQRTANPRGTERDSESTLDFRIHKHCKLNKHVAVDYKNKQRPLTL
jgi:tellurite resistance-related uncharacterized protein